jgi:DNA primase
MAKLAQNFAKYLVFARMRAKGIVEKPDIIGAIFGQTEGLLGQDLDLRELQRTGRIGRIEVMIKSNKGNSYAEIRIPSSLDAAETSLIAASLETIDKVGPCDAEIEINNVEDIRTQKRQYVIDRARDILTSMISSGLPDSQKLTESIKEAVRAHEISSYHGLSCGPDIMSSEEIIVVEGRADVINLLKNGIRNVIAIEGSKIPQEVIDLIKQKTTVAFLDGDRGGELDLKKLMAVAEIDYVAFAEKEMEVEELSKKQIFKSLRDKVPVNKERRIIEDIPEIKEEEEIDKESLKTLLDDLIGTRAAYLLDKSMKTLSKIPMSELSDLIDEFSDTHFIVIDGKINQSLVDMALQRKISYIVGPESREGIHPGNIKILTSKDL